jgi:2-dehydropantoate 2-reductase
MHIVFVGAGGIGGYFGARLIAAGERVSFVARGRHAEAIRRAGLHVTSPLGDLLVQPETVSADPAALAQADLLLFTVKLPDAEAAAAVLAPLLREDTVILPLQNGVEISELLAARFGPARVAAGAAYIATRVAAPGVIEHGGAFARLRFGALQPGQQGRLADLEQRCRRAGIDAGLVPDIQRTLWEKFVFLVGLSSLTALARHPIGVIRGEPELRRLLEQVMTETWALGRAEGVALADDFVARQMSFVDELPGEMKASMLHDLEAGRPLELPWLAGAVVRRSARLGREAPACRFVAAALSPYVSGAAR